MNDLYVIFEKTFDSLPRPGPYLLVYHCPVFKKEQSGNTDDIVLTSNITLLVNIYLGNFYFSLIFTGNFIENRMNHLTGHTPLGPKVHNYGNIRFQNLLFKIICCYINAGHSHTPYTKTNSIFLSDPSGGSLQLKWSHIPAHYGPPGDPHPKDTTHGVIFQAPP